MNKIVVIGVRVFDRDGVTNCRQVSTASCAFTSPRSARSTLVTSSLAAGNGGVISKILPVEDMPFLEDGTPSTSCSTRSVFLADERRTGSRNPPRLDCQPGWKVEGNPDWAKGPQWKPLVGLVPGPTSQRRCSTVLAKEIAGLFGVNSEDRRRT